MYMKLLFKGGTVISGEGMKKTDLLVKGEKILAAGENLSFRNAEIVDVRGKYLFPGFIDAHTQLASADNGMITADQFDTGTKAELAGGTTCIIEEAVQRKGEGLRQTLNHWHRKADGRCSCDYAFHLVLTDWKDAVSMELKDITAKDTMSFKLYTATDKRIDDAAIYEILCRLKELGGIAGVHCENDGIIRARLKEIEKRKGARVNVSDYPWTRPAEAEAEAVGRLLKIAKCVDTPVIIVNLTSAAGYKEILRAREEGQKVYIETCSHYLYLDDSRYSLPFDEARLYQVIPPLRKKNDMEVLWKALKEESIQVISSNHHGFMRKQKATGTEDFSRTPCGMPGAEERPALIWQYGVNEKKISPEQMCSLLSENPAKLYHLYPRKGALIPGSDADIVVWDPKKEWIITAEDLQSVCDYSPAEGIRIKGKAEQVYLRGNLAAANGKIMLEKTGGYICHAAPQRN